VKTIFGTLALAALLAARAADTGNGSEVELPAPTLPADQQDTRVDRVPGNVGPVFINDWDLVVEGSVPVQVRLTVRGNTPTPCHAPSWVIDDDGSTIALTMFTIPPGPAMGCIQVLQPFSVSINLGSYFNDSRSVTLNGELVGRFEP
jgi:hypothetical protein